MKTDRPWLAFSSISPRFHIAGFVISSSDGLVNHRLGNQEGLRMRGIISIVLGLIFIIGGLTGKLQLRFTDSGYALAVVGLCLIALGTYRIMKRA
jgi:hypothetical protein